MGAIQVQESHVAMQAGAGAGAPASRRVMNLAHFLTQQRRRQGAQPALLQGDRSSTWAELDARVDAMCRALRSRGVNKGDRVLIQSRNCLQMAETMFACFRIGAVWVPGNFRLSPSEVAYLAQASGAVAMICQAEFEAHACEVSSAARTVRSIIAIGNASFGDSYDTLVEQHRGAPFVASDVEYNDPCWFFFTSGTTGRPKAAVLTHGQMGFVVTNHVADLLPDTVDGESSLAVAPLSHAAGINLLVQVARGVKTVLTTQQRFDPEEVWALVERWRVSNLFAVPTLLNMLVEHPSVDRYDRSSLTCLLYAGAPLYRQDQQRALDKLGRVIVQYYGLGEVTAAATVLPARLHAGQGDGEVIGTCGFERTAMQISIQNEQGEELPLGRTGEICICGPAVFPGYFNDPAANAKAFRNGWFRTGDLGYQDERGFLFITGRASDMYISGGSNIYPREIEEQILRHPAIAEAAVVGVPDRKWGEVGVAIVVLARGKSCDEPELRRFLSERVASYKLPASIRFWSEIPKTGYGKVAKAQLRQQLQSEQAARRPA